MTASPQEQPRWETDKNLVRRAGWANVYAFACESDTQAEYAANLLTERDMAIAALEADLKSLRDAQPEPMDSKAYRMAVDVLRTELDTAKVNLDLMRPVVDRALAEDVFFERDRLRTENETLRAALEKIARPDRYDANDMAQIARAALTPPEKEQQG